MKSKLLFKFKLHKLLLVPLTVTPVIFSVACGYDQGTPPTKTNVKIDPKLEKTFSLIYENFIKWQETAPSGKTTFAYYLSSTSSTYNYEKLKYYALTMFGFTYTPGKEKELSDDFAATITKNSNVSDASILNDNWKSNAAELQKTLVQTVWNNCILLFMIGLCFSKQQGETGSSASQTPYSSNGLWGSFLDFSSANKSLDTNNKKYTIDINEISILNQQISAFFNKPEITPCAIKEILLNNAKLNLKTSEIKFSALKPNNQYCPPSSAFDPDKATQAKQPNIITPFYYNFLDWF